MVADKIYQVSSKIYQIKEFEIEVHNKYRTHEFATFTIELIQHQKIEIEDPLVVNARKAKTQKLSRLEKERQ